MDVIIYTDGSARNNPGKGGYGIVMISGSHRKSFPRGSSIQQIIEWNY